jgi:metal-sulfur cluster biosynthetic enzyme
MLRDAVWAALGTVLDPELDEPITELDFVAECTVDDDSVARVRLRLPTFFCAPNFSFLMVADAYDAVSAVSGVRRAEVVLADHHAAAEINGGVAAHAGFVETFAGEADADLADLRRYFLEKAVIAGQDRVAGRTAARTAERSPRSTGVCSRPHREATFDSSRNVPPYASPARTTWSPGAQTVRSRVSSAASPDANVSPVAPSSRAASASCSAVRVGLPLRLYS